MCIYLSLSNDLKINYKCDSHDLRTKTKRKAICLNLSAQLLHSNSIALCIMIL